MHAPLFWHGVDWHAMLVLHVAPVKPVLEQLHVYPLAPDVHAPPLRQGEPAQKLTGVAHVGPVNAIGQLHENDVTLFTQAPPLRQGPVPHCRSLEQFGPPYPVPVQLHVYEPTWLMHPLPWRQGVGDASHSLMSAQYRPVRVFPVLV